MQQTSEGKVGPTAKTREEKSLSHQVPKWEKKIKEIKMCGTQDWRIDP